MGETTTGASYDVKDLQERLNVRLENIDRAIANGVKIDGANVEMSQEVADDVKRWKGEADEIAGLIRLNSWSGEMKALATAAADVAAGGSTALRAGAAAGLIAPQQMKSLGEAFVESDVFTEFRKHPGLTMQQAFEVEGVDITALVGGRKDVWGLSGGTLAPNGFGPTQFDPMVPRAMRTNRVRDLFLGVATSANLIDYFRVVGFGSSRLDLTSGASVVPDRGNASGLYPATGTNVDTFGLKPKSNLSFEPDQAPVRTIAHYEVAHRNVLDDVPAMRGTIDNELLYGLRLEEDYQILRGTGTGEDLRGILNTPNIQSYNHSTNASDTYPDTLRRASTKVMLAYYDATGYVVHPYDWEVTELTKGSNSGGTAGDFQYAILTNVAIGADQRIWRQPVVATPAIPQGTFLTGAWGLGAVLYDRQQANVRVAEQHADFFIRNAVAILAEERLALAVKRPEAFVKGSFTA